MTSVDVGPPNAEAAKILAAPASAAPTNGAPVAAVIPGLIPAAPSGSPEAPKDERITVVTERPTEFVIQVDYLHAPENQPPVEGEAKK